MRFGVDVGGTFTDIVAVRPQGISASKLRSVRGAVPGGLWERLRGMEGGASEAGTLVHGTTVATNALLERTGGRVILATTAGFEDSLWLRRQDRAGLYDLSLHHPPPLVSLTDVIGVRERMSVDGVIEALTGEEIQRVVGEIASHAPDAVAVCFLFAFRDPVHERRLAGALRRELGTVPVVCSHEILPVFREYERTTTTVAEAYLRPPVGAYLGRMGREADARGFDRLRIMASNGGTMRVEQACVRAASLALSGPAGGVEGARLVGAALGDVDLLTVDMGGTSADASVVLGGSPLTEPGGAVGDIPLALPHILIETVGAGGGSVAWLDRGGALRVGPRSAGAMPGPACYGQGGEEAAVTDAALVLGWLDEEQPLADDLRLDRGLAERALNVVARAAGLSTARCAEGVIEIANAAMVRALRRVSVERGIDPRRMTLVPFGGAGALFACRMAESLGMRRALIPPHPGVLSALGLAAAPEKLEFVHSIHRLTGELDRRAVDAAFADLEATARQELPGAELVRLADCRYPGQGYELTVPVSAAGDAIAVAFHEFHRDRHGHADRTRSVDVVNLRLVARRPAEPLRIATTAGVAGPRNLRGRRVRLHGLAPGTQLRGPIMLDGVDATARIEPGWSGVVHESGAIVVERS